jgi:hypothetical protein
VAGDDGLTGGGREAADKHGSSRAPVLASYTLDLKTVIQVVSLKRPFIDAILISITNDFKCHFSFLRLTAFNGCLNYFWFFQITPRWHLPLSALQRTKCDLLSHRQTKGILLGRSEKNI